MSMVVRRIWGLRRLYGIMVAGFDVSTWTEFGISTTSPENERQRFRTKVNTTYVCVFQLKQLSQMQTRSSRSQIFRYFLTFLGSWMVKAYRSWMLRPPQSGARRGRRARSRSPRARGGDVEGCVFRDWNTMISGFHRGFVWRVSQNGWFIMGNPIEMDDLGVPPLQEPTYGAFLK